MPIPSQSEVALPKTYELLKKDAALVVIEVEDEDDDDDDHDDDVPAGKPQAGGFTTTFVGESALATKTVSSSSSSPLLHLRSFWSVA